MRIEEEVDYKGAQRRLSGGERIILYLDSGVGYAVEFVKTLRTVKGEFYQSRLYFS